ncbi:MAG: lipopolysaccharide biosynthesis protein [Methylophilus sp.]|uniref:lipopolysaccharide biosynthesis protein n=1 Tax=Methylophilus sp. TaxID=29541 RepID=UPI003F9EFEFC
MSLSGKAARGGVTMMTGQVFKVGLQLINLVVLARLLMPEDFGLVAMVVAIYGVCDIISDFGLATASIQVAKISKSQISNLFWINVLIGLVFATLSFNFSEELATFYGRSELVLIAQVMSLNFILNGISAQYKAQLNRELKFKQLVFTDVIAFSVGIATGIYCAYQNYSYWSIVAQLLSQASVQVLLYIAFGRWLPGLPTKDTEMSQFFKFGAGLVGTQLLAYFSNNLPSMLIGRYFGAISLGIFDRANKLLMVPINQFNGSFTTVAVPVLSRLNAEDISKYNRYLLFGQNIIFHICTAGLAAASCQTELLFSLVLGDQWIKMVPVFIGLTFAGVFTVLCHTVFVVYVTKGMTSSLLKLVTIGRPGVILITSLGLFSGVVGVAYAYSLALMVYWLYGIFWLKNSGIPVKEMIYRPLLTAFCYFAAAHISNYLISHSTSQGNYNLLIGWTYMSVILSIFFLLIPKFRESVTLLFEVKKYLRNKN